MTKAQRQSFNLIVVHWKEPFVILWLNNDSLSTTEREREEHICSVYMVKKFPIVCFLLWGRRSLNLNISLIMNIWCSGRGSRALLKKLKGGVLVHDASYCSAVQLKGPEAGIYLLFLAKLYLIFVLTYFRLVTGLLWDPWHLIKWTFVLLIKKENRYLCLFLSIIYPNLAIMSPEKRNSSKEITVFC